MAFISSTRECTGFKQSLKIAAVYAQCKILILSNKLICVDRCAMETRSLGCLDPLLIAGRGADARNPRSTISCALQGNGKQLSGLAKVRRMNQKLDVGNMSLRVVINTIDIGRTNNTPIGCLHHVHSTLI